MKGREFILLERVEALEEILYNSSALGMESITIKTSDLKMLLNEIEFNSNLVSEILLQTISHLPVYAQSPEKFSFEDYHNWLNFFIEATMYKMFIESY